MDIASKIEILFDNRFFLWHYSFFFLFLFVIISSQLHDLFLINHLLLSHLSPFVRSLTLIVWVDSEQFSNVRVQTVDERGQRMFLFVYVQVSVNSNSILLHFSSHTEWQLKKCGEKWFFCQFISNMIPFFLSLSLVICFAIAVDFQ